jgi:hypothetical protein
MLGLIMAATIGDMKMTDYRPLFDYELAEIKEWAAVEGRMWKHTLQSESWWRGIPARDRKGKVYPHLYGLRNSHGPSWLITFKLPKD